MFSVAFWRWYLRLLPLLMILVIASVAGYGATVLLRTARAPVQIEQQTTPNTSRQDPDALQKQADDLKDQADSLKAKEDDLRIEAESLKGKEDDLKWILGFILGAAALFAAGQAAGTWFGAQTFNRQAESTLSQLGHTKDEVDEAKDELKVRSKEALAEFEKATNEAKAYSEELQKAKEALNIRMQDTLAEFDRTLKARYPIYAQMADMWGDAFRNLTTILESASPGQNPDESFYWGRALYEKMPLRFRRQIVSAEQIAPYEIAGRSEPDSVYVMKLRRLARFYWSKFLYERAHGASSLADLEQAEYLLDQAMRKIGEAFYLLNDKGNIYLEYYKAHLMSLPSQRVESENADLQLTLNQAKLCFQDSLATRKEQLRASFNLAYIEAEFGPANTHADRLNKAVGFLTEGLRYANWEQEPVPEFTCKATYNLACYFARLPLTTENEEGCLSALREAAKLGLVDRTDVDRDFNSSTGDFAVVLEAVAPEKRVELRSIEKELVRNSK